MSFLPKTPSFRLDGKRALVAGASSGIGAACAVALAQAGAHVVLASRRMEPMKEMVQALLDEGCSAEAVHLDIADFGSIKSVIQDQAPFDVMINSAGIARQTPALETQEQDFDDVMNVNVKGAYFIARETAAKCWRLVSRVPLSHYHHKWVMLEGSAVRFIAPPNMLLKALPNLWLLNGVKVAFG